MTLDEKALANAKQDLSRALSAKVLNYRQIANINARIAYFTARVKEAA